MRFGGDKRDRTADLLTASQALSQLSYTPTYSPPLTRDSLFIVHEPARKVKSFSKKICIFRHLIFNPIFMVISPPLCYNVKKEVKSMGMFGYGMFSVIEAIFPIMFLLVFGVIIFGFIRSIRQWFHNNAQPRIPTEARIVAKRTNHSTHHHDNHNHSSTSYHVTFQFRSGDRTEISVSARDYGMMAESDEGVVTLQGTRFISFDRRYSSADPYRSDAYDRPPRPRNDDHYRDDQGPELKI